MDYQPNSHKYREEQQNKENDTREKRVEKTITGTASVKKKGELAKFADAFVSEDVKNVKNYILMDVLIPAVKKALSDIVKEGIDMLLYGGSGRSSGRSGNTYISYRNYSDKKDNRRPSEEPRSRNYFDFDEVEFDSRGDAEWAQGQLGDIIEAYGYAQVADLYELAKLTPPWTTNNYGWTNINNSKVVRKMNGKFVIKLPRACPIER